jgi:hypothetical protein
MTSNLPEPSCPSFSPQVYSPPTINDLMGVIQYLDSSVGVETGHGRRKVEDLRSTFSLIISIKRPDHPDPCRHTWEGERTDIGLVYNLAQIHHHWEMDGHLRQKCKDILHRQKKDIAVCFPDGTHPLTKIGAILTMECMCFDVSVEQAMSKVLVSDAFDTFHADIKSPPALFHEIQRIAKLKAGEEKAWFSLVTRVQDSLKEAERGPADNGKTDGQKVQK